MHPPRQISRCHRTLARLVLLTAITLAYCSSVSAQAPVLDSLRPVFGVRSDEFFKGAWMKIRPDDSTADTTTMDSHWQQIWQLADSLGIDILRIQGHDFDNFDITNAMVSQRTDWLRPRLSMFLLAIA